MIQFVYGTKLGSIWCQTRGLQELRCSSFVFLSSPPPPPKGAPTRRASLPSKAYELASGRD